MKKIITGTILSILALIITACGAAANSSQSSSTGGSPASNSAPSNSSSTGSPSALQIAAGMLKLDGTSKAVTAQEAAKLLPLWQSLQQIEGTAAPFGGSQSTPGAQPNTALQQQIGAQVTSIQDTMAPGQIQAITAMNLSRQDIFTIFQQAGIAIGGPGGGAGGFQPNGGTFAPPAARTPGAPGGGGSFGQGGTPRPGGRQGFGNFLPPSVVNGIVRYLQKKAGA